MEMKIGQGVVVVESTTSWSGTDLKGFLGIVSNIYPNPNGEDQVDVLLDGWDFPVLFAVGELAVQE
jgi:hypothetical protein